MIKVKEGKDMFLFGFIGLLVGSFLHVVGYRVPKGIYFSNKRSFCQNCGHVLSWYELLPLLSYGLQNGKCRSCHRTISLVYPLSELYCGLLFMLSYKKFGLTINLIYALVLVSVLFVLSVTDYYYYILPNYLLGFLLLTVILWTNHLAILSLRESLLAVIFSILLIGFLILQSNGGMGMGDFKLFAILAYFFGIKSFIELLFLSSVFALSYFGVLKLRAQINDKNKIEEKIYFGPFIVLASFVLIFIS